MSTKDEMQMKKKEFEKKINQILHQMLGGASVGVEVIEVPKGENIEQIMRQRGYKPVGEDEATAKVKRRAAVEAQRLEAIGIIQQRIQAAKDLTAAWAEMLEKVSVPIDDRRPGQIGEELDLVRTIDKLREQV